MTLKTQSMEKNLKISNGILRALIDCYDEEDRDSLARVSDIKKRVDSDYSIKATEEDISENVDLLNQVSQLNLSSRFIPSYSFGEYGIYTKCRLDYLEFVESEFQNKINSR